MLSLLTTTVVALLTALSTAQPLQSRQGSTVTATLAGAAGAQYTISLPIDAGWIATDNALSVSHISTSAYSGQCTFFGVDGVVVVVSEGPGMDVGPPQTIAGGVCGKFPGLSYGMW
jgi:hypothetical protein